MPDLQPRLQSEEWWMAPASDALRLIAVTRDAGCPHLETWLDQAAGPALQIWLAIGPEGGWSERELAQALASGWIGVTLGTTIRAAPLRRSPVSVPCPANTQRLMPSRRNAFISGCPLTCMRRSKVVCTLMDGWFDALSGGETATTALGPS